MWIIRFYLKKKKTGDSVSKGYHKRKREKDISLVIRKIILKLRFIINKTVWS